MSDENDSWLKSALGIDVSTILPNIPDYSPPDVSNSFTSGAKEAFQSAGSAIKNLAGAAWDTAAAAGAGVASAGAGVIADGASYVGADDTAQDFRRWQAEAEADQKRYSQEAGREFNQAEQDLGVNWTPPGYPFPTPPPVPKDPPDLPPDSRPVPVPPGPEPDVKATGDDDLPDTQPRPGPQPNPDRPPDSQLPPTQPRPLPPLDPNRPPDSQLPPTLPRPFHQEAEYGG